MINPSTLLPYGVERPRTLREFLLDKIIKVGIEGLTFAEFSEAKRLMRTYAPLQDFIYEDRC